MPAGREESAKDRFQFQLDPDDVTDRDQRLVGVELAEHDRADEQEAWVAIVVALTPVRDTVDRLGRGGA